MQIVARLPSIPRDPRAHHSLHQANPGRFTVPPDGLSGRRAGRMRDLQTEAGDSMDLLLGPFAALGLCQPDGTFVTLGDAREPARPGPPSRPPSRCRERRGMVHALQAATGSLALLSRRPAALPPTWSPERGAGPAVAVLPPTCAVCGGAGLEGGLGVGCALPVASRTGGGAWGPEAERLHAPATREAASVASSTRGRATNGCHALTCP
jgi:hypothetical protein